MDEQLRQEAEVIQNLELDVRLWKTLNALSPEVVCRRSLASYNPDLSCYVIQVLDESFQVSPQEMAVSPVRDKANPLSIELRLMILQYLVGAKELPLARKWVTEKELRNGEMFYRGVHSLETFKKPLAERFGQCPDGFRAAGRSIGGVRADYGDVGIEFRVLPRVPSLYVLWAGDEEFPPKMNILFDSTVECHLALDTIWGMVRVITFRLLDL